MTSVKLLIASLLVFGCATARPEALWLPQDRVIVWPLKMLPLSVYSDMPAYNESLEDAVSAFNSDVGCDLFRVTKGSSTVTIRRSEHTNYDDRMAIAGTRLTSDRSAEILVYRPGDLTEMYLVFYHELGHVVGLAHDDLGSGSIMVSNVSDYAKNLGHYLLPRLTPSDAKALWDRYCR